MNPTHLSDYERHGIVTVLAYCVFLLACAFRMTQHVAFPLNSIVNALAIIIEAGTAGAWLLATAQLVRDYAATHARHAHVSHSRVPLVTP